jgi:hypothetical protein
MTMFKKDLATPDLQWTTPSDSRSEPEMPKGWKYRSLKLGPVTLPYYASPESQLILVSFVCFLCPGKAASSSIQSQLQSSANHVKACSTLLLDSVEQDSLIKTKTSTQAMLQTAHCTLHLRSSASSPARSPILSVSGLPSRSVVLATVSMSAHSCASIIPPISVTLSSLAYSWDAVQVYSGLRRAPS